MNTPKLQQTLFENLDPTPSAHVGSSTSNKMKRKKSLLHPNKSTHLARKLINLLQVFKPIPFVPKHAFNLSIHEKLLKRAGLWNFLHIKFDPALRSDLIAELIVSYSPKAPSYRRSFVNGLPINLTRSAMGRALGLPSRRKARESCGGFEVVSDEELLFLEKVVLKWVVLGGVNDDVLDVLRFVKKEGRPEWVDWANVVWVMVERELVKGVELVECYYASHLQCFLRKHRPNLFAEEVGKLGFVDLGVQELGLGILGVDERENEKKGNSLVGYQRRKNESGEMVDREGQNLGGSSFGHGENEIEKRLEVVNFGEKGGGDMLGGERSGVNVNNDGGEEIVDERLTGLENDEAGLSLMQDGHANELKGECFVKEGEDTGGETESENIGLINEEGKEVDCKHNASIIYATEIEMEKSGLLVQHGEGDNEADVKMSGADDDSGKQLENELLGWLAEQGKDNQLKLDISVKEDEGMIGVNFSDSGDSYAMEQESETVGYCSLQGELELKAKQLEYEQIDMIQGKSDIGDREIGLDLGLKESDEMVLATSVKECEDGSIDFCLLQSEMKMEGLLKEGEDVKMSSADDDDDGKELEIRKASLISEHGRSVMENQEKGLGVRQGEKGEVLEQADSAKQDGVVIDVEVSSSGNSSGNQYESNQMHSCARQSICSSDFAAVVREDDDTVDFEDIKEKDKKQVLFQQCSVSMDAGCDSQSEKAVEVVEEGNVDYEEREEKDRERLFQHCSLSTDAGSQSQKAVEVSEDGYSDSARNLHCSPHSKVNDSQFVEPSVTGTRMKMEIASSNFFGNALKRKKAHANDVFIEPFVLEQNINADMSGASEFENSLKTEIDLLNDGHKRLRTEESDEEPMTNMDMSGTGVSMFPLKRKMDHTSDGHGIMISEGQSNEDSMDLNSWEEKVDFWLAEAKMVYAAREEAWISAQLKEQKLVKKLEELDNTIHFYEKTKHEEIQKRNSKINCLENELFFMENQIDHYKKALQATHKTFAAYKERCGLPEEPLYRDFPGSGGIVLSTTEWEKERLRRELEDRTNHLLIDMMIKDFQLQWSDKLKGHAKKIMSLDNRLSDVEKEAKDLRTFSKTGFRESEK